MTKLPASIGRYRVLGVLGQGGMGRVYDAELVGPAGFRKPVALKVLVGAVGEHDRERLFHEARVGGRLRHPNVVETYELGTIDDVPFIAMERVDGPSLRQLLDDRGPLPGQALVDLGIQLLAALAHLHQANVVHRDVKPGNVLLDRNGLVKLADLGIATSRVGGDAGEGAGTPGYMAPEALDGTAGPAADLFSVGVVLYEAAVGRRLFVGSREVRLASLRAVDARTGAKDFRDALERCAPGLATVVTGLLRSDPRERYRTAELASGALALLRRVAPGATLPAVGRHSMAPPERATPTASSAHGEVDAFVGRERELAALGERTAAGARLVTLKGMGGTGKTRLALEFAAGWDGDVVMVELEGARVASDIVRTVALALGVSPTAGDVDETPSRVEHALAARGPCLVILDNLEQVVEAAAELLGRWLTAAPLATLVVTSRERLRIGREVVLEVGALRPREAVELVRLRAQARGIDLSKADGAVLDALVARLDRLPLALELAAARLDVWTPAQLLERLERHFDVLTSDLRGTRARQATLRGAVEWSWQLLPPWEQAALAQLSVFRGGFELAGAEQVLDLSAWPEAPWAVDTLQSLWNRSLVARTAGDGPTRFRVWESVRRHAEEHLSPADRAATRLRHAIWCASFGRNWAQHPSSTLLESRRERDNLLAGVEAALELGRPDLAAGILTPLREALGATGPYPTGMALAERVLAACPEPGPSRMRALTAVANWSRVLGHLDRGLQTAEEALRIGEAHGAPQERSWTRLALLGVQATLGQFEAAEEGYLEVYEEFLSRGLRYDASRVLATLAVVADHRGDVDLAIERGVAADGMQRELDQRDALLLSNIGTHYARFGRVEEAMAYYREAITVARGAGERRVEWMARMNLSNSLLELGRYEEAWPEIVAVLEALQQVGDRRSTALAIANRGWYRFEAGDLDAAERDLREAEAILADRPPSRSHDDVRGLLAVILLATERVPEALPLLERLARPNGLPEELALVAARRAEALARLGRHAEALAEIGQISLAQAELPEILLRVCVAFALTGDAPAARILLNRADRQFEERPRRRWLQRLATSARGVVSRARR